VLPNRGKNELFVENFVVVAAAAFNDPTAAKGTKTNSIPLFE